MSVVINRIGEEQLDIRALPREVTDHDQLIYDAVTTETITAEQARWIAEPTDVFPRQSSIVALHWHPEFVPMDLIRRRIAAMFPQADERLIIPTQHNILDSYDEFTGVEVDCYSPAFHRKTQLLFHFRTERLEGRGDTFKAMLAHTFKYRQSQLWQFIDTIIDPVYDHHVAAAAERTGANEALVEFVRVYVGRIKRLIDQNERRTAPVMLRNKLLVNFFDMLRGEYADRLINHVQVFLRAVKNIVKARFSLEYFYRERECIEEGRALGACIVIPHPEQFWPILLEDLDVDGIEVWNPQSLEFTEFLIHYVARENRTRRRHDRPLLVTMGDDCHMGEKVKDPRYRDALKAEREVGVQPPWEDLNIKKNLIMANATREDLIREYKSRLGSGHVPGTGTVTARPE